MEQQNLYIILDMDWFGHKHHSVTDAVLSLVDYFLQRK